MRLLVSKFNRDAVKPEALFSLLQYDCLASIARLLMYDSCAETGATAVSVSDLHQKTLYRYM